MKNFSLLLILMLGLGVYFGLRFHYNIKANDGRILRVGVECDYAPQNWEENNETDSNVPISNKEGAYAEGYDVQIAKLVAATMGAKLEIKKIEWSELLPALNGHEIDVVFSAMLDTEERKNVADFSSSYELRKTVYVLVVNKKSGYTEGRKLSDFSGARIVGQAASNLDAVIDQIPGVIHVEPVSDVNAVINEVLSNDADGFVIDIDTGKVYCERYPDLIQIEFPDGEGFNLGYTGVCAAVRKSDHQLLQDINAAISRITPDERSRIMDAVIVRERDRT